MYVHIHTDTDQIIIIAIKSMDQWYRNLLTKMNRPMNHPAEM